jgi:KaiC/GvpD/RAD55 family RecA-like ATPase
VEPISVRLIPNASDLYAWDISPEIQHLFSKQISNHSTKEYKQLYEGVGVKFKVIRASTSGSQASFSEQIKELQIDNTRLKEEVRQWRDQAVIDSEYRQRAEDKASQLTATNQKLQHEARVKAALIEHLTQNLLEYIQGLDKIRPLLESNTPYNQENAAAP